MNEKTRKEIALFRYGILAPLISGTYDQNISIQGFFREAAGKLYTTPSGEDTKIAASTLERWYYNYKNKGFDALMPIRRCDTGRSRKLDVDITEQIKYLKGEYPRIPATLIYQKLVDNGTIIKSDISLSTINRYINQLKLENKYSNNKEMKRYEREHINEVWCGDSSVGPYIKIEGGNKKRVYIIALIDDASRYITGIDIFFNDNFVNLMSVLKSAVTRFGKPKILNFDNGASYKNKQMELLAARIGTIINYCAPYTPQSKAKIERWFRTLKDQWMSQLNMKDFKTLDELRISLNSYVNSYNQHVHSSLNGLSPQDRFFKESHMIKRLSSDEIENSFLLEYERRVSADNVVVIDETEYEVDYRYSKQKITLRYSPDLSKIYVVDKNTGGLTEIKLLNKHDNSIVKRNKFKLSEGGE
ncbi:DDE-type integrase/transposase/recombinase [Clostridium butyricum]|jgi:transposase InsO family protein|uniref:DDE-type integrase/transposase/recombinase n=2 Tax=Clostridium butyricum TaxID=1492 RepID=UPI00149445ED|nr:DDE-type integrase/transposase/recombinase [Clostridium butyricum]NOW21503.1 transposase InsO family protein [Clostridium butyricum]NOW22154.1 transposase InsO family protein [Clostridium butyricum]NOW23492.1 transposase InsO family protein [Clostridium butyricum]NOW23868.1 transposase InsO family protein [Clostridium butyricum]NOW25210.1 transposase InsO family protein [Clostridium butyricum]